MQLSSPAISIFPPLPATAPLPQGPYYASEASQLLLFSSSTLRASGGEWSNESSGCERKSEADDFDSQVKDTADIKVVGHRVVHGGESFTGSALIDHSAMAAIRAAASLAPLHNPANITGIEVAQSLFPCPQVGLASSPAVFAVAAHFLSINRRSPMPVMPWRDS